MEPKPPNFHSGIDQLRVVAVYGFFFCVLAFVCRLLSHLIPGMGGANAIRVVYFVECSILLPLGWKYQTAGPFITLSGLAFLFDPIVPVRIGNWAVWQCLNFLSLICIGVCGLMIENKRKRIKEPFDLAHKEWVMSLPDREE
jgi:hypothetical protein